MACLIPTPLYFPVPTREWSRVQGICTYPNTNTNTNSNALNPDIQMREKGNILQYKQNSGNLSQKQKYSLIAQGKWVNRNTTWATQSTRGYTNPNVQSLQRVGGTNTTLDGTPTTLPVTCPKPVKVVFPVIPAKNYSPYYKPGDKPPEPEEELPEPIPQPPGFNSGTAMPYVPPPPAPAPIVIPNEGNLVCQTIEDTCSGKVIKKYTVSNKFLSSCNLSSASDVPGTSILCWNDGLQTWYPRQRYIMTNSGNKWPVNAVLVSAIKKPTK